jgi:hypothetical protein
MCSCSHAILVFGKHFAAHSWVVQQPQRVVACIAELVEPVLIDAQTDRNGLHHLHVEVLAYLKEAQHLLSEDFAVFVESIWPLILQAFNTFTTDLQRLFQVSSFESSLFLNLDWVYEICCLFASLTDIAAVGFWCRPCKLLFLADWSLEEICAVLECFFYCGFVDAVFTDVDEACCLEP